MSNVRKVARNSFWYGLEVFIATIAILGTSFVIGRTFGPQRLGYYNYLVWLTYMTGMLGSVGLPAATQKYMAEYLSKQQPGVAAAIFRLGFQAQLTLVGLLLSIGLPLVWHFAPVEYRWVAIWLVVGIAPRMLGFLVSQVNAVSENMARNMPAALAGNLVAVAINMAAVWFDWGLLGLAVSHPVGHTTEFIVKYASTLATRRQWRQAGGPTKLEPELRLRIRKFALQGLGLVVLNIVVWDRSDVFLLRHLNPDLSQVTFFSYSFSLIERLLTVPQIIGVAMGLNLMTSFGKEERQRLVALTVSSATYLLLIGLPVMLGALAMSRPLWMIYGDKFAPAVPVFMIMAMLAVPRTVMAPANSLLQATERQFFMLGSTLVCGAVNLGLDVILIPAHGAIGAAIGNGIGQTLAAVSAWTYIAISFKPELNAGRLVRILMSALAMMATVLTLTGYMPPLSGALIAVPAGVLVYLFMLRLTGTLQAEDRDRFMSLSGSFPAALRYPVNRILWTIIPQPR